MILFKAVKVCVVAGLAVGLVAAGLAVPAGAQSGVTLEMCLRSHSSPAGDFVTAPVDTDGDGVADTCVLANYFGSEPGVGSALERLRDAHIVEYRCHLEAVRAGQPSNCRTPPASPAPLPSLPLFPGSDPVGLDGPVLQVQQGQGQVALNQIERGGVTAEVCLRSHSSPAGDFVTAPGDTNGDGVAETCVLANYFGSEPGVGSALKRLRDVHVVEYRCHLAAVLAGQPSNCGERAAEQDEVPPADSVLLGFENGRWLIANHPEVATSLEELEWASDGLDEAETEVVRVLLLTAADDIDLVELLLSTDWLSDGVTHDEFHLVLDLYLLSMTNSQAVRDIVQAPFLDSVEAHDVLAVEALRWLSFRDRSEVNSVLERLEDNGGFTDYWARIVPVISGTDRFNPGLVDRLLNPGSVQLEIQTVPLAHSGQTEIAIIRTGTSEPPRTTASMNHLVHAVRTIERFMGAPLHFSYVVVLYEDAVLPEAGGTHFGTHITIVPDVDVILSVYPTSGASRFAYSIIPHEVAHYYFTGATTWINEGAAEFLGQFSENKRIGTPIVLDTQNCGVSSLAELERIAPTDLTQDAFLCNYTLGENVFVELYQTLGEQAFRKGLRDLYQTIINRELDDPPVGLQEVRAAFGAEGGNAADQAISKWYYR